MSRVFIQLILITFYWYYHLLSTSQDLVRIPSPPVFPKWRLGL